MRRLPHSATEATAARTDPPNRSTDRLYVPNDRLPATWSTRSWSVRGAETNDLVER